MTNNKKVKIPNKAVYNRVQFNLAAKKDHIDHQMLLEAKELFNKLVEANKISRTALLLKLVRSFSLKDDFTPLEKQLVEAAAEHEGVSTQEFNRRGALLYANKILKQTVDDYDEDTQSTSKGACFIAKPIIKADLKVAQIVAEIMHSNDIATSWLDKKEITPRSVTQWGKHANSSIKYKSINTLVLKRYFMLHRDEIKQHHLKHGIKPDHNRRAVAANRHQSNSVSKLANQQNNV